MDAISQPEALEYLWTVVDKPAPLNPLLASFFSKVVQTLLQKEVEPVSGTPRCSRLARQAWVVRLFTYSLSDVCVWRLQLTTYLLGTPTLLFKLIGHLGTPAVMVRRRTFCRPCTHVAQLTA